MKKLIDFFLVVEYFKEINENQGELYEQSFYFPFFFSNYLYNDDKKFC